MSKNPYICDSIDFRGLSMEDFYSAKTAQI